MKNNILNIVLLIIVSIFTFNFNNIINDNLLFLISILFAFTFVMFYKRKSVNKTLYNVINDLLIILSILIIGNMICSNIKCMMNSHCINDHNFEASVILYTSLLILLFMNILDIKIKKTKLYNCLFVIVNVLVIIIYLRYYLDSSFIHNYIYLDETEMQHTYIYISQNYIYFNILYIGLLIGYFINKKK